MSSSDDLCHCGRSARREEQPDPWEGRLDGYCGDCASARCDAYPGECPNASERPRIPTLQEALHMKELMHRRAQRAEAAGARLVADMRRAVEQYQALMQPASGSSPVLKGNK